ncbi:15863_t:CDS:2 [Funneliformis caledonium]|uniref:15863_t:CDS:1 n=1 Tax=Funneliformis caledonium TaxID=1117310 RepID=A0A9N8VNJ0_9GLOM|nr:15863_t:CDS:2 [Funneliformis caledonium]
MPPTRTQKSTADTRISHFRSFTNFDKMINDKTVRCKCGVEIRLDRPFRTINFERHIKSQNCILGTEQQPSLFVFFDQSQVMDEECEVELDEPLPYNVNVTLEIVVDDDENDENNKIQNLLEQDKLQIEADNIGTAAFEISRLLLDESDDDKTNSSKTI